MNEEEKSARYEKSPPLSKQGESQRDVQEWNINYITVYDEEDEDEGKNWHVLGGSPHTNSHTQWAGRVIIYTPK